VELSAFALRMCSGTEVRNIVSGCGSTMDSLWDRAVGTAGWDSHVLVALRSYAETLREAPVAVVREARVEGFSRPTRRQPGEVVGSASAPAGIEIRRAMCLSRSRRAVLAGDQSRSTGGSSSRHRSTASARRRSWRSPVRPTSDRTHRTDVSRRLNIAGVPLVYVEPAGVIA